MIKVFRSDSGPIVETDGRYVALPNVSWDDLFTDARLPGQLSEMIASAPGTSLPTDDHLLPPIDSQEVWAAGVTYMRSKSARMEEAKVAGGGDFYDRVYVAERPELFFKATRHRVVGNGQAVRIRRDTSWSVPEPELALVVNAAGTIIGYTIGNDMSARDIEGENPLYLPQAKVYDQCCALGPALLLTSEPLSGDTAIALTITRGEATVFEDTTTLSTMKRTPEELVDFLFRDNSFPAGCILLTGTGIVPPDEFTLHPDDRIRITIAPIGTLENYVVQHHG